MGPIQNPVSPYDGFSLANASEQFRVLAIADNLLSEYMKRKNSDAILIPDDPENSGNTYVPRNVYQIKSATGNVGTFDGSNSNILFQQAPPINSEAFKQWFGESKVVDENGNPLVVYHGTDAAFTTFSNTGEKLPSLGYGYYFTPDISKAQQYGSNIMPVYISAERLLDWGSLSNEDRSKIIDRLNDKVPESEIAGYGKEVRKSFDDTEKGRQAGEKFFEKKKVETENYFHDRAKARVEQSLDGLKIDVVWMEPGLENASNQDLLALAQQYDIQIAENLGYDAARFGNEIVVFAPTKIKSVNNQGTWDSYNPNILFQQAHPVGTKEFNEQFGKSKAVDENGNPKLLYHGSPNKSITALDNTGVRRINGGEPGYIYATDGYDMAEEFSREKFRGQSNLSVILGDTGRVYPVYMRMENPLDFRNLTDTDIDNMVAAARKYSQFKNTVPAQLEKARTDKGMAQQYLKREAEDLVSHLEEYGYDGLISEARKGGPYEYAVISPSQVYMAEDQDTRFETLSTRLPSAKGIGIYPLNELKVLGYDVLLSDLPTLEKNLKQMYKTVNMREPDSGMSPKEQLESIIDHIVNNLLFLHDHMDAAQRMRAKLWYVGARKTVEAWARRYGISEMQGAALIAVLSPQNGWFPNVTQAERIADMIFGMRDYRWDEAMTSEAEKLIAMTKKNAEKSIAKKTLLLESDDEKVIRKATREIEKAKTDFIYYENTMRAAFGHTLGELLKTPDIAARYIRIYDQVHNDRSYRIISPEGGVLEYVTTDKGENATAAWKGFDTIAKGVSILMDGRTENVYYQIGQQHKVRNFYNNIFDPFSKDGFTTIDTHAVAAALLRPLSSSDVEVNQAFGNAGASSSSNTGLNGTYPIYLEAYKRAAEQRGLLPREMQSITWEAVRGLFEASQKSGLKKDADKIWKRYKAGEITQAQAQAEIIELSGDITAPSWAASEYTDTIQRTYSGPPQQAIDARGDIGRSKPKGKLALEVAPDPNNKELTAEWNSLAYNDKAEITSTIIEKIIPEALKELGVGGETISMIGGYEGATNPSIGLVLEREGLLLSAAKLLGYALSQDSMAIISDKEVLGTSPVDAVVITLPEGYGAIEIEALYKRIYELQDNGSHLADGHTTANGFMTILNFSGMDIQEFTRLIYKHLNGEFETRWIGLFSALIEKEEYQDVPGTDKTRRAAGWAPVQGRSNRLRDEASFLLQQEISRRKNRVQGRSEEGSQGTEDLSTTRFELSESGTAAGLDGSETKPRPISEKYMQRHRTQVQAAMKRGLTVPDRVLEAYAGEEWADMVGNTRKPWS